MARINSVRAKKGFVAIITAIVVSMILSAMLFSLSTGVFFMRNSVGEDANTESSYKNALSCSTIALSTRIDIPTYAPSGDRHTFPDLHTCIVDSLSQRGTILNVITESQVGTSFTRITTIAQQPGGEGTPISILYRSK